MSTSCKRGVSLCLFICFGSFCVMVAWDLYEKTNDIEYSISTFILYLFLSLSAPARYHQFLDEWQRFCSVVGLLICYGLYWWNLTSLLVESPKEERLQLMTGCSFATFF